MMQTLPLDIYLESDGAKNIFVQKRTGSGEQISAFRILRPVQFAEGSGLLSGAADAEGASVRSQSGFNAQVLISTEARIQNAFDERVLYLCSLDDLPDVIRQIEAGVHATPERMLVCGVPAQAGHAPANTGLNAGIQYFEGQKPCRLILLANQTVAEALQSAMEAFASYASWRERMLLAIADQAPMKRFLGIVAEGLANPFALMDADLIELACVGTFEKSVEGTIWERFEDGVLPVMGFYSIDEFRNLAHQLAETGGAPIYFRPRRDPGHTYASFSISVRGKTVGSVGSVDINAPFSQGQREALKIAAEMISRYFGVTGTLDEAHGERAGIGQLLSGQQASTRLITQYLHNRGWGMNDDFAVVRIDCPVANLGPLETSTFVQLLVPVFPRAMFAQRDDWIAAIVRRNDFSGDAWRQAVERLGELAMANELFCGISMTFSDFSRAAIYCEQASAAARFARAQGSSRVMDYQSCYREHLLDCLGQAGSPAIFCNPKLLELWRNDRASRELIECLGVFLADGRNISAASRDLCVHRNTLIYRLEKIERSLGIVLKDLDSSEVFIDMFSCMLLEKYGDEICKVSRE